MKRYLLDTNTVSFLIRMQPEVLTHVANVPMAALSISAITEGELSFGLAKRPEAKRLHLLVHEFLLRVDVAPWDRAVAQRYGTLRAECERAGTILAPLDLLIAAHALAIGAMLVSNDHAFRNIKNLPLVDWTQATR